MKNIVANELKQMGFEVTEFINGLLISLKSRKVSVMEVDTALLQSLDIRVGMSQVPQGVFIGTVTWDN